MSSSNSTYGVSTPVIVAEPWVQVLDYEITLEGLAFDRHGNLFFSVPRGDQDGYRVFKLSPDRKITRIWRDDRSLIASIKIHQDGTLFLLDVGVGNPKAGKIITMRPDGGDVTEILTDVDGGPVWPCDAIFDSRGNLYFTDFQGMPYRPTGRILRLSADLRTVDLVAEGFARPDGISLAPGERRLWIGEMSRDMLVYLDLKDDGITVETAGWVYHFTGELGPDGNAVDEQGNVYQTHAFQGKAVVFDKHGVPVQEVVTPGRVDGKQLRTNSVAFQPGTDQAFVTADGWIMTFRGLAPGLRLFSHH